MFYTEQQHFEEHDDVLHGAALCLGTRLCTTRSCIMFKNTEMHYAELQFVCLGT